MSIESQFFEIQYSYLLLDNQGRFKKDKKKAR